MSGTADLIIIGGGVVGLASARGVLERFPGARIVLLEKEPEIARHQTGHNSGVVHSGIYYAPGSAKARLCVLGRNELLTYAAQRGIPHRVTGKLIVATEDRQLPMLEELGRRGQANGVEGVRRVSASDIPSFEPAVRGRAALHVPSSAIIDFRAVARELAKDLMDAGGALITGARVDRISIDPNGVEVGCGNGSRYRAHQFVNCAGLYADTVARRAGASVPDRILPFRGEFHAFPPERSGLVRSLVYPVPDPRLPFLDVHLTPTVDGRLLAGPNAILAFAREGYRWTDWNLSELAATLTYPGFWRMIRRVPDAVAGEVYRSLSREAIAEDLRRMVPSVRAEELRPIEAGVRAQAVAPDGSLREDFVFVRTPRALHVVNAPSPAATSSFAIGAEVAARIPDPRIA